MLKKIIIMIFTVFFLSTQGLWLYGMDKSLQDRPLQFDENDISVAARILRTAVINWRFEEVKDIIDLYKKNFRNSLVRILYDIGTSLGRKTLIEDLFCYRLQSIGGHKEILTTLVHEFKNVCICSGLTEDAANQETIRWMLFNSEKRVFPSIIDLRCYKDVTYLTDLLLVFFVSINELGGQDTINKRLDTSLNGRGCTLRQVILSQVPIGYYRRLSECLAKA